MLRNFITIEELNVHYANSINELSQISDNINDEVLKQMLKELMTDYKINLHVLKSELDFIVIMNEKRLHIQRKQAKIDFRFQAKQFRFDYRQCRKRYRRLYRQYKRNKRYKKLQFNSGNKL